MNVPTPRLAAASLLALAFAPCVAYAQSSATAASVDAAAAEADIHVIGVTPLPGVGVPPAQIPASLQRAGGEALERSPGVGLADTLNRAFGSVHVNEMQGNRLQPELSFRGYTASPLLGTPQGLSVYLDGVRLNQPFGDVVSWDLVPRSALSSVNLVPGSNPLFGLNTLGGAVTLQTKDGRSHPGSAIEARAGTHGFGEALFEHGGRGSSLDWYVTGVALGDAGWREASPSRLGQLFGKLGWQDATTDLKLTYAHADTSLNGNGLQEEKFLRRNYGSVYTKPDVTQARSHFANLAWSHALDEASLFSGNAYYRESTTTTYNADLNDQSLDQATYQPNAAEQAALAAAGYRGFPAAGESAANTPFPAWRCIANVLRNDEPGEKCNALVNRTRTAQQSRGFAAQWSSSTPFAGVPSRASAGFAVDESRANFTQGSQLGYLNPDRSVTLLPAFADGGVTGGNVDGVPFDTRVALDARTRTSSLYAAQTFTPIDALHVSASARHNRTRVQNADRLRAPGLTSLDGDYVFERLNPAAGIAFTPSSALNAYLGYNEGSRTPSAIELGCANPAQPCRLPNAMAGDPPLRQVVTRTWETGVHGALPGGARWHAGLFRAENADDILFVAAPLRSQFGFFRNFGRTRREGTELGWSQASGAWRAALNYSYVRATFESPETLSASANSSNDAALAGTPGLDGTIRIRPGDRMPLVPAHQLKASAGYAFTPAFSMDAQLIAMGMSYARGNENNLDQPDGVRYLGAGRSPGYAILNLGARHEVDRSLSLFAQVDNLFDRRYSSGSLLAATGFDASGNFAARPLPAVGTAFPLVHATFQAPGAPRSAWVGARYRWQ